MTKEEILKRVKEIQKEQGDLETELELLWVDLQKIEDPNFSGWTKHPW
ncbi:MAG: hypothetical protein UX99_C0010G0001 [Candidatus Amesbacteria bacterium GW2011_GWB1_47_26]|nr:MAG: hypothetical protein UX99_C0010G0001 [Candidatus Amesbacteria bacterium GW2011_GWB1_47_26]KKU79935.1 MAG: hypothetical protein UY06_C0010G0004 [Candidatus Amesbacteria bacterium GW2011_GWA2_47_70]